MRGSSTLVALPLSILHVWMDAYVIPFQMTQELDLKSPMCDIVSGLTTGAAPPVLVLQSEIFMSANQVAINQLVDIRRTTTT